MSERSGKITSNSCCGCVEPSECVRIGFLLIRSTVHINVVFEVAPQPLHYLGELGAPLPPPAAKSKPLQG